MLYTNAGILHKYLYVLLSPRSPSHPTRHNGLHDRRASPATSIKLDGSVAWQMYANAYQIFVHVDISWI